MAAHYEIAGAGPGLHEESGTAAGTATGTMGPTPA